jgi:hypothetical protein
MPQIAGTGIDVKDLVTAFAVEMVVVVTVRFVAGGLPGQ